MQDIPKHTQQSKQLVGPTKASGSNEFVRVPFYREEDGTKTFFLPNMWRSSGFQIGDKKSERYVSDYWEALAALNKMPIPYFRRPNKNKNFGRIVCSPDDYEEIKRQYIENQLSAVAR